MPFYKSGKQDMTIADCLRQASLLTLVSESARLDLELLLAKALDCNRTYLYTWPDAILTPEQENDFAAMLARRQQGEPIAHILGEQEFWSCMLYVDDSTLIPRSDTEVLVEQALAKLPSRPCKVLDMGTGTGAIAIALASERADCQFIASDISESALKLAARNVARHELHNVSLLQSDWFAALDDAGFDLIVSNPPYIAPDDVHLSNATLEFEPDSALIAEGNGLADIINIVDQASAYLAIGGWLLLEHGWQQGQDVRKIMSDANYMDVATVRDYGGNDRVSFGRFQGG